MATPAECAKGIHAAAAEILSKMVAAGMLPQDGWTVGYRERFTAGGTSFELRPIRPECGHWRVSKKLTATLFVPVLTSRFESEFEPLKSEEATRDRIEIGFERAGRPDPQPLVPRGLPEQPF